MDIFFEKISSSLLLMLLIKNSKINLFKSKEKINRDFRSG
jgi:hypothetical protein